MMPLTYMGRAGFSDVISVTPTLDTNAYGTGDRLGSLHTITGAMRIVNGTAVLQTLTVLDQAKQLAAFDLLFFNSTVTIASADNAAIDISDAEMLAKFIGAISVTETHIALANSSVVSKTNIGLLLKGLSSPTVYALPVIRATATYAAASLRFDYGFLQD